MGRRKTHEEFVKEVHELVGDEYTVVGEYVDAKTKIAVMHNEELCGFCEYKVKPNGFLGGNRCPKCAPRLIGQKRRLTQAEFDRRVEESHGGEYVFLDKYVNSTTKIKVRHVSDKCNNYEYLVAPLSFLDPSRGCPRCSGHVKTHEDFLKDVEASLGGGYEVLDQYENSKKKCRIRHVECGNVFSSTPESFKSREWRKLGCQNCNKRSQKTQKTHSQFTEEVRGLVGSEYSIIGKYKNAMTKIEFVHNSCNHAYSVSPNNFLRGKRCPECFGWRKKTTEEFADEVKGLVGNEYTVSGEYKAARKKVEFTHNECDRKFEMIAYSFMAGNRCPHCSASRGESSVSEALDEYGLNYEHQYTFDDCINKRPLPFDFCVLSEDKTPLVAIEYDGIQHFEPRAHFGGTKGFEATNINDNIKNEYCQKNNIPLLRIPYWEFDNINCLVFDKLVELDIIEEVLA